MKTAAVITVLLCWTAALADVPPTVELRLHDGSRLRGELLTDSLEIDVYYGRLTVPMAEVRKIDFGLHYTPEEETKLRTWVKDLGSLDHPARDKASRELAAHGWRALPMLDGAAGSTDLEVKTRAETAARSIRKVADRSPATGDTIATVRFPIKGRVLARSIKLRSPILGEIEVGLEHVESLTTATQAVVINLPAEKGSHADGWLDTGIDLHAGETLTIQAEGSADFWPAQPGTYVSGPGGLTGAPGMNGVNQAGVLVGQIGGNAFPIGEAYSNIPPATGRLHLRVWPSAWNVAAIGGYKVTVRVK